MSVDFKLKIEDLGKPFESCYMSSPLVVEDERRGKLTLYFTEWSTEGGLFLKADYETGELLGRWDLEGRGSPELGIFEAPDGRIYIPDLSSGHLSRYSPREDFFEDLGQAITEGRHSPWREGRGERCFCAVWGADSRVYGGSAGTGRIWSYDPEESRFEDHGPALEGEPYVWSLAVLPDGQIACGMAPHAALVVFDPQTGEKVDIWPHDVLPGKQWLYDMALDDSGKLYVTCVPGPEVAIFDAESLNYEGALDYDGESSDDRRINYLESWQGNVYGITKPSGHLVRIDATEGISKVGEFGPHKSCDFTVAPTGECVILRAQEPVFHIIDTTTGQSREMRVKYPGKGADLRVVKQVSGSVYLTAYPNQILVRRSLNEETFERLGQISDSGGQPECIVEQDGLLWIFSYPFAWVSVYDPEKSWNPGREKGSNPWQVKSLGFEQNRPRQAVLGPDGRIYITSVSDYGVRGGALLQFDPDTLEVEAERFEDFSAQGLAIADGLVFVGLSVRDESSLPERSKAASIRVWDIRREEWVDELSPIPDATAYTILASTPDGRHLLGSVGNQLFRHEIEGKETAVADSGFSRVTSLVVAEDETVGTADGVVFRWDLSSDTVEAISEDSGGPLDHLERGSGAFFAARGSHLIQFLRKAQ